VRIIDVHSHAPEQNAALHANACVAAPTLPVYPLPRSMISDYNTPDEAKYGVRNLFYVSISRTHSTHHAMVLHHVALTFGTSAESFSPTCLPPCLPACLHVACLPDFPPVVLCWYQSAVLHPTHCVLCSLSPSASRCRASS
jgi:hypothetical protein